MSDTPAVHIQNKRIQNLIRYEKAPIDTAHLRRSTRSTRYDGFRVPQITDAKKYQTKVKQRVAPSVRCISMATDPHASPMAEGKADAVPPDMPIQQIQYVGSVLCGIPAEDLSPQKLLASHGTGQGPDLQ